MLAACLLLEQGDDLFDPVGFEVAGLDATSATRFADAAPLLGMLEVIATLLYEFVVRAEESHLLVFPKVAGDDLVARVKHECSQSRNLEGP